MLKRVLVANRGEIAVRIIRACREAGIETVAVYSTADKNAMHVQLATKAYCIGDARSGDSYLNIHNLLTVATATGCSAVHPGYGFLSENSQFARLCQSCNMKFIGPSPDVIDRMGNKSQARKLMIQAGVPVVPGSDGTVDTVEEAKALANKIGYPVLLKASAGGGGRGMRKVFEESQMESLYASAKAEAKACFNDDAMYMEKLIIDPKHIEFQILADGHGNVIHLGERDCSLQRRGQKMMEESPCAALSPELRARMGADAVKAAKIVGYQSAGTVEFILDDRQNYYFIEMNTRVQVEHPVTEMLTGVDIIHEQLRVASGLPLSVQQPEFSGHCIECRINAEDPSGNFSPSAGVVDFIHLPGGFGTRIDTALYSGCEISPFYDSMIAKVIVKGRTRLEAIRRMRRVLEEMVVEGVTTNIGFQHLLMYHKDILRGDYNTGFIEANMEDILKTYENAKEVTNESVREEA